MIVWGDLMKASITFIQSSISILWVISFSVTYLINFSDQQQKVIKRTHENQK